MFTGFTSETIDFLWGIRFNNERSWFEPRKEIYLTQLYRPMVELADEVYAHLRDLRPGQGLTRKVTRIYRDTRRSHGRGPYKDGLWFSVQQPAEDWRDQPSFFFELDPDSWLYGLGDMTSPSSAAKLRARMDRDPRPMEALVGALERQKEFEVELAQYKRSKGEAPSERLRPWYQARYFNILHRDVPSELLFSHALAEQVKEGLASLLPWYDYFVTLSSDPEAGGGEVCRV